MGTKDNNVWERAKSLPLVTATLAVLEVRRIGLLVARESHQLAAGQMELSASRFEQVEATIITALWRDEMSLLVW